MVTSCLYRSYCYAFFSLHLRCLKRVPDLIFFLVCHFFSGKTFNKICTIELFCTFNQRRSFSATRNHIFAPLNLLIFVFLLICLIFFSLPSLFSPFYLGKVVLHKCHYFLLWELLLKCSDSIQRNRYHFFTFFWQSFWFFGSRYRFLLYRNKFLGHLRHFEDISFICKKSI